MSERYRVLVADNVSESGLAPLLEDGRFEVERGGSGLEAFGDSLRTADALIVRSATKVDRDLLTRAPRLRVVGRAGVGVDNIDLPEATERGIAVLNAPAGNTVSAAELTMALMLALVRRIPSADRSVRASEWKRSRFAGLELRGKSLGLVGAGRIGGEVARRARAFGMEIMGYDPYLTEERADELGVDRVEFEELLSRADVISLHVPLTDRTRMMIGGTELTAVKPGAFLVNVARGGVVDEAALAAALVDGRLAGAALDVYAQEPLEADSPLRTAPNIILTPHLGASTAEAQELVATEIAAAVAAALLHGDLSRALNAPAIGGDELRRMRPLLGLGQRLGRLAAALSEGATKGVEVRYTGESRDGLRALSSYVLMGLLGSMLGQDQVNFVNAPHLAEGRGVGVSRHLLARRSDYTEFVEVVVSSEEGRRTRVAGALLGDQHPRLVRIDDYHIDIEPRASLLVLRNRDVPGVIGRVGTLLGDEGLNIAEYHQARFSEGGEALAAVAVDGQVQAAVVERLRQLPEIADARVVDLG